MFFALNFIKSGSPAATELLPKHGLLVLKSKPGVLLHQQKKIFVLSLSISPLLTEEKSPYYTNSMLGAGKVKDGHNSLLSSLAS